MSNLCVLSCEAISATYALGIAGMISNDGFFLLFQAHGMYRFDLFNLMKPYTWKAS